MDQRTAADPRIAVIGAGMSGIAAAIKLEQQGYTDIVLYEKAERLGGTWRENTYPGLSCDVPSHLYTYSFEPNPDWSHLFSPGAEIQAYFEAVARKYGVDRRIRYRREVVRAEHAGTHWRLTFGDGDTVEADVVIAATGVLHHPAYPDIDGLGRFEGPCFHTARWDHDVALDGARIGIIGTGSTACQIVPAIISRVSRLALFQRTPQWILPMANPAYSEAERAAFRRSPEKMKAVYDEWAYRFNHRFGRAVIGDQVEIERIAALCRRNLEENVRDPALRRKLTPSYTVACKRLIMSDTFYPALQQPNAALVTAPIERIEARGVRTGDGALHELDVLVLATGFDAHAFMRPMAITGRNGTTLDTVWRDANLTHRSVAIPDFPNFFLLIGPNSPIGNFPLILVVEQQLDYILQLLEPMRRGACRSIVPRREAAEAFQKAVREAMQGTIWMSGCKSWYLDKNGTPVTWPWDFERFQQDMRAPDLREYELIA